MRSYIVISHISYFVSGSDPDMSCFVRCTSAAFSTTNVTGKENTSVKETDASFANEMYLFIELTMTVRVPTGPIVDSVRVAAKVVSSEEKTKLDARAKARADAVNEKKSRSNGKGKTKAGDDDDDDDEEEESEIDTKDNGATKTESVKTASTKSGGKPVINDLTVDMCSGWAFVPLKDVLLGKQIRYLTKMNGGTAFSPVGVKKSEIQNRAGTIEVRIVLFTQFNIFLWYSLSLYLSRSLSFTDDKTYNTYPYKIRA